MRTIKNEAASIFWCAVRTLQDLADTEARPIEHRKLKADR